MSFSYCTRFIPYSIHLFVAYSQIMNIFQIHPPAFLPCAAAYYIIFLGIQMARRLFKFILLWIYYCNLRLGKHKFTTWYVLCWIVHSLTGVRGDCSQRSHSNTFI